MIYSEKENRPAIIRPAIIQEYLINHPNASLKELGTLLGISRQRVHVLLQGMDLKTERINNWRP